MDINALRQYMDFANQNNMFGGGWKDSASSYDPSGQRAQWAASMMQQQQPQEFFQGQTPSYTAPQSVQSLAGQSGFPLAPQDQPPSMQRRPEVTRAGMAANYLRTLFTR